MVSSHSDESLRLDNLKDFPNGLVLDYTLSRKIIVFGKTLELIVPLRIDHKTLPEGSRYVLAFASISRMDRKLEKDNPVLDMGPVISLTEPDLETIVRITRERSNGKLGVEYDTPNFNLSFSKGGEQEDKFRFNIRDKSAKVGGLYGSEVSYQINPQILRKFIELFEIKYNQSLLEQIR